MLKALKLLREKYHFGGYIHVKAIPGADERLLYALGILADRMSVNIEFPSQSSLKKLAPDKSKESILLPMAKIRDGIKENRTDIVKYKSAPKFAAGGQSTQMIIGASPESDYQILQLTEGLYRKFQLKRVFFSAYMPVLEGKNLPALNTAVPLLREHRLYQADWLLRFYGFTANEILDGEHSDFNPVLDPKCNWAVNHFDEFPVEVNRVPYETLLRVPGIGVISARRIITARRHSALDFESLKKLGVVLKRAKYFVTCKGRYMADWRTDNRAVLAGILKDRGLPQNSGIEIPQQLSLFDVTGEDKRKCLTGQM
jgi:putative DNA modification/repair radical SAM protein